MGTSLIKEQSNIDNEAISILEQKRYFIMPSIMLVIHTKDDDIEVQVVTNVRISRNFTTNLTDVIHLEFIIASGTFNSRIYPNRDNLEVSIIFSYEDKAVRVLTYKFLLSTDKANPHSSHDDGMNEGEQDAQQIFTIKGQCVDKLTLNLKNKYISGIYHDYDLAYFMKSLINYEMTKFNVSYKINVYDIDNNDTQKNIFIRPFTKLIKLPLLLQNDLYGVYNSGINIYFTKIRYGGEYPVGGAPTTPNLDDPEWLFGTGEEYDVEIYPLFDNTRFDKETKRPRLVLVSPSAKDIAKNQNDFFYKDGFFKLVVSDVTFKDSTANGRYDTGTTLSLTDSAKLKDTSSYDVTNDKIKYDDSTLNTLETIGDKPSTFDSIVDLGNDFNPYKYRSTLNQNEHMMGIIKVGNINPDFIYPGMPFNYVFEKDGVIVSTNGTVQSVEYFYDLPHKTVVTAIVGLFKRMQEN